MSNQMEMLAGLAGLIDNALPGARRYAPIVEATGGFAIAVPGGGQVVVWSAPVAPGEPWFLNYSVGIARDVPDLGAALSWVNTKNADFRFGRFYVSIPGSEPARGNVVYRETVYSGLIEAAPQAVNGYVGELLQLATQVAGDEPQGFVQVVGGSPYGDTDQDRSALVMAAMG